MGLGDVAVEGGLNLLGAGDARHRASVAVALHQLTDEIEIAGEGDDHDVVAMVLAQMNDSFDATAAIQIGG
jgi:hypothetical protein